HFCSQMVRVQKQRCLFLCPISSYRSPSLSKPQTQPSMKQ
uniref:Uncharacterized protein n=1 Tax=Amphimedon queenslandica TaxID=400682 RepID=A0A1X7VCR2_AMPQE